MKINITRAQLAVLEAIARGEVSKPNHTGYDMGTWRIGRGRAVTIPTETLIRKGLAQLGHTAELRLFARITDTGRVVLDDLADRGPEPSPKGMRTAHELTATSTTPTSQKGNRR